MSPPLRTAGSFMGVPWATDAHGAGAVVLGLPFDCGTHPARIGCRLGPAAIREQSRLVRPYYPAIADRDPLAELVVRDLGDVAVTPSEVEPALAAIEAATAHALAAGAAPVGLGGDGITSLGMLRAVGKAHPGLALLHIDAHTDAYPLEGCDTGTTFTRAAEEGLLDLPRSFHVGARGTLFLPDAWAHAKKLGYQVITGAEVGAMGLPALLQRLHGTLAGRPVHLCLDVDYFDPSCAPGVATPTWGGPGAREGLALIEGLKGLNVVAADVNTVSPPQDVGGMSAYLAAQLVLASLHLILAARERKG